MSNGGVPRAVRILAVFVGSFCVVAAALFWYVRRPPTGEHLSPEHEGPAWGVDYKKTPIWADAIPRLCRATRLVPEDAVRWMLQADGILRTYVLIDLRAGCDPDSVDPVCTGNFGDPALENAITKRIDGIVAARIKRDSAITSVEYEMTRQPFPLRTIVVIRIDRNPYVRLVYDLTRGNGYSGTQIEKEHGAPKERGADRDSNPLLTYTERAGDCDAKTDFQLDPDSGEVRQVSIGVGSGPTTTTAPM